MVLVVVLFAPQTLLLHDSLQLSVPQGLVDDLLTGVAQHAGPLAVQRDILMGHPQSWGPEVQKNLLQLFQPAHGQVIGGHHCGAPAACRAPASSTSTHLARIKQNSLVLADGAVELGNLQDGSRGVLLEVSGDSQRLQGALQLVPTGVEQDLETHSVCQAADGAAAAFQVLQVETKGLRLQFLQEAQAPDDVARFTDEMKTVLFEKSLLLSLGQVLNADFVQSSVIRRGQHGLMRVLPRRQASRGGAEVRRVAAQGTGCRGPTFLRATKVHRVRAATPTRGLDFLHEGRRRLSRLVGRRGSGWADGGAVSGGSITQPCQASQRYRQYSELLCCESRWVAGLLPKRRRGGRETQPPER
eukprot:RCo000837